METKKEIDNVFSKFEKWGMLDHLTEYEKKRIYNDLTGIAKEAILETKQHINSSANFLLNNF